MTVIIRDSNRHGALSEQRLTEFENKLGYPLPIDYRNFLLAHNGGRPTPSDFKIDGEHGSSTLQSLWGIHDGLSNLLRELETFQGRVPATLMPIGNDPGGNLLCIAVSGENKGAIYFWEHEFESEEGETPTFDNVYRVAGTFSELLEKLTVLPLSEIESDELYQACKTGNLDLLNRFLDGGGDIHVQDAFGKSLVQIAAMHNQPAVVRMLVGRGANLDMALTIAAQNGHGPLVEYLISAGAPVNEKDPSSNGNTPLITAAAFGLTPVVKILLAHGADVNAKNDRGQTALAKAARSKHEQVTQLLIEAGAQ